MYILTRHVHTAYEYTLAKTRHSFLAYVRNEGWNHQSRPLPPNYRQFYDFDALIETRQLDLLLAHTESDLKIYRHFNKPVILKVHTMQTLPPGRELMDHVSSVSFSSEEAAVNWDSERAKVHVVRHGIDLEFFGGYSGQGKTCLVVANTFSKRDADYAVMVSDAARLFSTSLVGAGNDEPYAIGEADSYHGLRECYRQHKVYLNASRVVSLSTLEAMATGMPVVMFPPTNHCPLMVHEENVLIVRNAEELATAVQLLESQPELRRRLGQAARETVKKYFGLPEFIERWNQLFTASA